MRAGRFGWNFAVLGMARRALIRLLAVVGVVLGLIAIATGGSVVAGATPVSAPGTPTDIFAVAGQNSVTLYWVVPANNGAAITNYTITAYHGTTVFGAATVPSGAVGSTLDPTPGANDQIYLKNQPGATAVSFTVAAVNSVGTGTASIDNPGAAVTPTTGATAPYAPSNVKGTSPANFESQITWTVTPNNGDTISGFFIAETGGSDLTLPAGAVGSSLDPTPGATDSYTFTGLRPGTYSYTVAAMVGASISNDYDAATGPVAVNGPDLEATPVNEPIDFGSVTLGDYDGPKTVQWKNYGTMPASITNVTFGGNGADDYTVDGGTCNNVAPQATCTMNIYFNPGTLDYRNATLTIDTGDPWPTTVTVTGFGSIGYYQYGAAGEVGNFGDAGYYGDASAVQLNRPIVGMSTTGDDGGYWLVASDGGIFSFGDARFFGSTGGIHLNKPIVGMATTPDGGGYWLVASDGGIFAFGDAQFYGSTGDINLNKPIVGMAATPDGGGYWLVASDGGIFSFGDAPFYGSTGAIHLNKPIVGMASTPDGGGYWMVASDGGIFTFGNAQYFGSTGAIHTPAPIKSMSAMPDGGGYWMTDGDGDIYNFGDAPNQQSVASLGVTDVIGVVTDGEPTVQAELDIPASRHHAEDEFHASTGVASAHNLSRHIW